MGNIFAFGPAEGEITVGDFRITLVPPLGSGSFGQVYLARKRKTKESVAAKGIAIMSEGKINHEIETMALKERENMMRSMGHPNIVELLDYQVQAGMVWLFMDYCDRGDLEKYLSNNSDLDFGRKLEIKQQIASALAFLHNQNPPIIHRDVKPQNVLMKRVGDHDVVKVTDFGFAKIYDNANTLSKQINTSLKGTPSYMAPEFSLEEETGPKYTASVDVFSLGLLFAVILQYSTENPFMIPASVEAQKTGKHVNLGYEMCHCKKADRPLPYIVEIKENDPRHIAQMKELILRMTRFYDKERPQMKEVEKETAEILSTTIPGNASSEVTNETAPGSTNQEKRSSLPMMMELERELTLRRVKKKTLKADAGENREPTPKTGPRADSIPCDQLPTLRETPARSPRQSTLPRPKPSPKPKPGAKTTGGSLHEITSSLDLSKPITKPVPEEDRASENEPRRHDTELTVSAKPKLKPKPTLPPKPASLSGSRPLSESPSQRINPLLRSKPRPGPRPVTRKESSSSENAWARSIWHQLDSQCALEPSEEYIPHAADKFTAEIKPEAPSSFRLSRISENEIRPSSLPPSLSLRLFKDSKIFAHVDRHSIKVSEQQHKCFRDLIWHLIFAPGITNELEIARAIFLWLCVKDLNKLNFDNVSEDSPEEILMNLKHEKAHYPDVFKSLCSYAGLHCVHINGYAKSVAYDPGMAFPNDVCKHRWNAVFVNGAWRLVDCDWGARSCIGKKVTMENLRYKLDDFYFMTDPLNMVLTHFPLDASWQILHLPITLDSFEKVIFVKSRFFKLGLKTVSHPHVVIHADNGDVIIRIACPEAKQETLSFMFKLMFEDGREDYEGIKLTRYGMHYMADNIAFFTLRLPQTGSYYMEIKAKDLADNENQSGTYGDVCEYKVLCDATPLAQVPFPPCSDTSWGFSNSISRDRIEAKQTGAIFSTVQGKAEFTFSVPKEFQCKAKLKCNNIQDEKLQSFIVSRIVGSEAVVTMYAPSVGEYGLELYVDDPDRSADTLYHVCQYLITCVDTSASINPLPVMHFGALGEKPSSKQLGLTDVSHKDPFVQNAMETELVSFNMVEALRLSSKLTYSSEGKEEDCSEYVLQQTEEQRTHFLIKFPKTGYFKFAVFALPSADSSSSLKNVFNYLFCCNASVQAAVAFPKQYKQYKECCFLHEPRDGYLTPILPHPSGNQSHDALYFKINVIKAVAVVVIVGEDWIQLKQGQNDLWEGDVAMVTHWGKQHKAKVCAKYDSTKSSYDTLLEYTM